MFSRQAKQVQLGTPIAIISACNDWFKPFSRSIVRSLIIFNHTVMNRKTLPSFFVALTLFTAIGAQTPLYFNIVSHNEISDSLDYTDNEGHFNYIKPLIKELCDTVIAKQAKYNMQVDGNFIVGVLKYDDGATSSDDILEWASNSDYIDVNPHNHFNPIPNNPTNKYNPYKFPDLAYLLDSCGVVSEKNILGGVTYADTTIGMFVLHENWTQYATPQPGFTFTNYFWKADIVWGTATPGHIADYTHFGEWKPAGGSSPTQFGIHDPTKTITHIGGGCKNDVSYILDENHHLVRTTDEVVGNIIDIVDGIQATPPASNDFYTMNMLINFRDIPAIPHFADSIAAIIDGLQPYVEQGKIVWATLGEKYDMWYAEHPDPNDYFNVDCNDLAPVAVEDLEADESIAVYPNPVSEILTVSNFPRAAQWAVFSLLGEQVPLSMNAAHEIDVSQLSPGMYALVLTQNGRILVSKFIKQQ